MVLVILAVVWAIYLVSWARSRTEHRRVNSINSFSRHLSTLERTAPGTRGLGGGRGSSVSSLSVSSMPGEAYFAPHRPSLSQTKKRRRDILVGLLVATGVTFMATLAIGGLATYAFVLVLVLTVVYVVALANLQKQALERRAKVRYLSDAIPRRWPLRLRCGPRRRTSTRSTTPRTPPATATRCVRCTPSAVVEQPCRRLRWGSAFGRLRRRALGPPWACTLAISAVSHRSGPSGDHGP